MTHRLSPEIVAALRAPFAAAAVKWKIETNPKPGKDLALVVAYLDARDVAERLDDAAGGDWWDDYTIPQRGDHKNLECRLTVCGVTRVDVGESDSTKDLYSDAFKRAAVKFGIGRFLYRLPVVYAQAEKFGNTWSLTKDTQAQLVTLTDNKQPPRLEALYVRGTYQAPPVVETAPRGRSHSGAANRRPVELAAVGTDVFDD